MILKDSNLKNTNLKIILIKLTTLNGPKCV
jgi:hypothetical protein